MEKKFKHEKVETCSLCEKVIHTDKDKWVSLIDLTGSNISSVKFYHQFCFTDLIKGKGKVIEKNFTTKVNTIVQNLMKGINTQLGDGSQKNPDKKEVYEIR